MPPVPAQEIQSRLVIRNIDRLSESDLKNTILDGGTVAAVSSKITAVD